MRSISCLDKCYIVIVFQQIFGFLPVHFILELYSDSDVESELSCEEILEGQPHRHSRRRQVTGHTYNKEKRQATDSIQENYGGCSNSTKSIV